MGCCMYKRPHHQRIARLLQAFDADLLRKAECYFGGGTAIVLALDEYRESVDVDFLCASRDGYRLLRNTVSEQGLGALLTQPVEYVRRVRSDRDKVGTVLAVDATPIKVEFVREARITLAPSQATTVGVPTLSSDDMYVEKLLANTDRGLDKAVMSRDLIDLAMMVHHWGPVPEAAWEKVIGAYGRETVRILEKTCRMVEQRDYLARCLTDMHMDAALVDTIPTWLADLSTHARAALAAFDTPSADETSFPKP